MMFYAVHFSLEILCIFLSLKQELNYVYHNIFAKVTELYFVVRGLLNQLLKNRLTFNYFMVIYFIINH